MVLLPQKKKNNYFLRITNQDEILKVDFLFSFKWECRGYNFLKSETFQGLSPSFWSQLCCLGSLVVGVWAVSSQGLWASQSIHTLHGSGLEGLSSGDPGTSMFLKNQLMKTLGFWCLGQLPRYKTRFVKKAKKVSTEINIPPDISIFSRLVFSSRKPSHQKMSSCCFHLIHILAQWACIYKTQHFIMSPASSFTDHTLTSSQLQICIYLSTQFGSLFYCSIHEPFQFLQ